MTLRNVLQAFQHCANRYCECPVYVQLVNHGIQAEPVPILALS